MLGGGTNMLVSDSGVRGVVLQNDWSGSSVDGTTITAASGTPLASVAAVAARNGIVGLEWMATVPGTVGGAVHGNAGAFGSETKDQLVDATLMDLNGDTWTVHERGAGIRVSHLESAEDADHRRQRALPRNAGRSRERGEAHQGDRERTDREATARAAEHGSIFRNPAGDHAGRLIEAAGLKGARAADAMVSTKHANFIVNMGEASAKDVKALMDRCQREVKERFDVELVPEVELVGEW